MSNPSDARTSGAPRLVRPGERMLCGNGHRSDRLHAVPRELPRGSWLVRCVACGWTARLRPHFGDRPQDLCYVVEEELSADHRRRYAAFLEGRERPAPGEAILRNHDYNQGDDE